MQVKRVIMPLAVCHWMSNAHHCSSSLSVKWSIMCWVQR